MTAESPSDPAPYRLYAEAAQGIGRQWESHEAAGEYYYLNGETHSAIQQLDLALRSEGMTYYDNARISARLKKFKQEAALEQQAH